VLVLVVVPLSAQAPRAVFVVRHAEKVDDSKDPLLSAQGQARASALGDLLRDAGISAIFATEFQRTKDTAAPLAARLRLRVTTIPAADQKTLVARVRQAEGAVLIVGHSNTIPDLLKALGCEEPVQIADEEYDNLFVIVPKPEGPPTLLRIHY
jgi:broad specificity phosphatase PhoE